MARISVEQKALTDSRFELLGKFLESNRHDALGRMILVWNECQERESYTLPERLVSAIMSDRDGSDWIVQADLAVWIDDETLRIKGTEGRTDWLGIKRQTARLNGKKGGRPKNQSRTNIGSPLITEENLCETPPTPTPTPTSVCVMQNPPDQSTHTPSKNGQEKDPLQRYLERYAGPKLKPGEAEAAFARLRASGATSEALLTDINRTDRNIHELPREFEARFAAPNRTAAIEKEMLDRRNEK